MTTALEVATDLVLMQYTEEPCRICGRRLTLEDVLDHAVFTGYSSDKKSRAAHRECWVRFLDLAAQLDAVGDLAPMLKRWRGGV